MGYGKKSFKEKFNSAANSAGKKFKRLLLWTGLVGAAASPIAYEYGTIKEQTVKVESYTGNDDDGYSVKTDKGTFNIEKSRLHFQSKEVVHSLYWPINGGQTYDIKTYGWHLLGNWQPNIIGVHAVTQEDLEKRQADLKKQKEDDKKNTNTTTTQTGNTTTQPALSGQMVTTNVIINGYNVQITIPVEAAGKVTINSVAPVVQTNNVTTQPVNNPTPPVNNPNPPTP